MRIFLFPTLLLISICLPSCLYLKSLVGLGPVRPKVELETVEIEEISLAKMTLQVGLSVENPNDFDLKLANLHYAVNMGDLKVAEGVSNEEKTLVAEKTISVVLPITVDVANLADLVQKFLQHPDQAKVTIWTSFDFDTGMGMINVEHTQEKSLGRSR